MHRGQIEFGTAYLVHGAQAQRGRRSPPFFLCMFGHMLYVPRMHYLVHSEGVEGPVRETRLAHPLAAQAPAAGAIKTQAPGRRERCIDLPPDRSPDAQIGAGMRSDSGRNACRIRQARARAWTKNEIPIQGSNLPEP